MGKSFEIESQEATKQTSNKLDYKRIKIIILTLCSATYSFFFLITLFIGFENYINFFEELFKAQAFLPIIIPALFALIYTTLTLYLSYKKENSQKSFSVFNIIGLISLGLCFIVLPFIDYPDTSSFATLIYTSVACLISLIVAVVGVFIVKKVEKKYKKSTFKNS